MISNRSPLVPTLRVGMQPATLCVAWTAGAVGFGRWTRSVQDGIPTRSVGTRTKKRKGSIAIVVMVCLVVIVMLSGVLLRLGQAGRAVIRGEERRLQAEWLAESGVARASARLAESPDYTGETWELSAEQMAGPAPGVVTIAVETPGGKPSRRRVRVRADYPRGDHPARVGKQVVIDLEPARKGDSP